MPVSPPMFADEMIQELTKSPAFTREYEQARIRLLRSLAIVSRMQCAYAHHTEHTYTKEFQWREIHRATVAAYKTITGKELSYFLQTIPDGE